MAKVPAGKRTLRSLSRTKVISAALALLDREGTGRLSMRAVAEELGVTPMALYNHFRDKAHLQSAIADHIIESATFDAGLDDWREQIEHCFHQLRKLCLRHPVLPKLIEEDGAAPANVFRPMEVTLTALGGAGLDGLDALRAYFLLVSFTLGQAAYQVRGPVAQLEPEQGLWRREALGHGSGEPAAEADLPWDFDSSFAYGLSIILDGISLKLRRSAQE